MGIRARETAFGGMMTAVAVVIMSLGSLIPVNTYTCPVLCILITRPVRQRCGAKTAWCYYMAVAALSLMLAPDREAALVYALAGGYPLIRHRFEKIRPDWLGMGVKILFFSLVGGLSMVMTMWIIGVEVFFAGAEGAEVWMLALTVILWDVLFVLVDRLLGMKWRKIRK